MHTPTEIKRLGTDGLKITWSDGSTHTISSRTLRENCPAADSRAKRGDTSHDAPLTTKKGSALRIIEASVTEELSLQRIWAVGNYALGIAWADGHDTGIYTYDLLFSLGELERKQTNSKRNAQ